MCGEKELILKDKKSNVSIPHLNIKGIIKEVNENKIIVELSKYAKTYLETTEINIYKDNLELKENEKVFLKFNEIDIKEDRANYSSIDVYKLIEKIKIEDEKEDYYICKNDYGGFMKVTGTSFRYNNNIYFKSDTDLSENDETYFVNIKTGILLIEEIKSIIFPFKIYNMINPQETMFNEVIEIYK